jgi:glycosyltransferase involved in cell wall biosynthesis
MTLQPEERRIAMFNVHSDPLVAIGTQENGGQNVYVRSLMTELDRQGWLVDVFTRWNDTRKKQIVPVGKRSRVIRIQAGPIAHVKKFDLLEHLPEFYKHFLEFINNENPYHIFHGHYWDGGWLGLQAQRQFQVPFVQTYHSLGEVRFNVQERFAQAARDNYAEARFHVETEVGQNASGIITLSQTEKDDLHTLYGIANEKIHVIPGAVNFRMFHPMTREYARAVVGIPQRDFVVVYVGRLEWRKGIGTLISAIKLLQQDVPNIRALIVGGGIFGKQRNKEDVAEYERLKKKAQEEGVEDRIQFVGRINHSKIHVYYSTGNAHVVPSYYEPFGLVALEGMACQIPVVASRQGGLKMTIQDGTTGLLFETRDAQDFATQIKKLALSPDLVGTLVKNAYSYVRENHSQKQITKKISDLYTTYIDQTV